jgi:hypothetical protein
MLLDSFQFQSVQWCSCILLVKHTQWCVDQPCCVTCSCMGASSQSSEKSVRTYTQYALAFVQFCAPCYVLCGGVLLSWRRGRDM